MRRDERFICILALCSALIDPPRMQSPMTMIVEPHPDRLPAFRPKRRSAVWRFVKRYQLLELIVIVGGICLAWLGVALSSGQL